MLASLKPHCKGHQMTLKHTAGTSAEGKAMLKTEFVDFLLGTATSHLPVPSTGAWIPVLGCQPQLCCVLVQCERCGRERKDLLGLLLGKELAFSP